MVPGRRKRFAATERYKKAKQEGRQQITNCEEWEAKEDRLRGSQGFCVSMDFVRAER
jgi:hypothetical protein